MNTLEKVLYTARAHTTGGRDGGASRTDDGNIDLKYNVITSQAADYVREAQHA